VREDRKRNIPRSIIMRWNGWPAMDINEPGPEWGYRGGRRHEKGGSLRAVISTVQLRGVGGKVSGGSGT